MQEYNKKSFFFALFGCFFLNMFHKRNMDESLHISNAHYSVIVSGLVARRERLGKTQDELNAELGYTERLISKWETDANSPCSRKPSPFALQCWAEALHIKLKHATNREQLNENLNKLSRLYAYQKTLMAFVKKETVNADMWNRSRHNRSLCSCENTEQNSSSINRARYASYSRNRQ